MEKRLLNNLLRSQKILNKVYYDSFITTYRLVINNALKKGISISSSIFNNINQKIILNDIKFIIVDNRKYFYTQIDGIQYYCVFRPQQKRILEFFYPKSFSQNKYGL